MKCRLTRVMRGDAGELSVGHEIDDPECYWLVRQGVAEPIDEECRLKAGMTAEAMAAAAEAYEKLAQGRSTGEPKYDAPAADGAEESLADGLES